MNRPERTGVGVGLIVVGDEVLNGTRVDGHLPQFKRILAARGHYLAWFWLLPDDPPVLTAHLARSMAEQLPVFCCGGIGATPDDHTRACAAAAAGVGLARDAGAVALIEGRFGAEAWPHRVRMADLPVGAGLIPNPVNQVPGFGLNGHWFLPGFPQMAWPMAAWVLDRHYPTGAMMVERAVRVLGVPESRLIPLLERLDARFPGLKLFSLPHLPAALPARSPAAPTPHAPNDPRNDPPTEQPPDPTPDQQNGQSEPASAAPLAGAPVMDEPSVLLGFRGHGDADAALTVLMAELDSLGFIYRASD